MTKQEQIKEMSTHIKSCEEIDCIRCKFFKEEDCCLLFKSEGLYDAGYKQEKEVAKELLKDVGNITIIDGDGEAFCLKDIDSFKKICKKYGAIIEDEIPNIEEIF